MKMLLSLKKYWSLLLLTAILTIIYIVSTILIPLYFGYMLDLFDLTFDQKQFNNYILIIIVLILIASICNYLMLLINNYLVSHATKDLREKTFSKLHQLPISYFDLHNSGTIINNVILNVENYNDSLLIMLNDLPRNVLTVLAIFIIMFVLSWKVTIVLVISTPISILLAKFLSKKSYHYYNELNKKRQDETNIINETIHNQKNIINYNYNDKAIEKFLNINEEYSKISFKSTFISSMINPPSRLVFSLIYASIAFVAAYSMITSDVFTVGTLATLLAYVNQFTKPFNEITAVISEIQNGAASYNNILKYLDEENDIDTGNEEFHDAPFDIQFKNLYFSYNENFKLINDFNLTVKAGTKIAIVGKTGAGKTTLINLLMRFYDANNGDILFNNGSIYKVSKNALRNNFGMVLQDTWIKDGTLYENITMGNHYDEEKINDILKICKLDTFVNNLPDGLNTIINDSKNLSIGQKQLICIARVMLANKDILLLDEATSNIDLQTEIEINNAFNKLMEGKTTFVVAHRLKTIENADIIIVLKDGDIVETGNHQALIQKQGYYYDLYNAQFEAQNK